MNILKKIKAFGLAAVMTFGVLLSSFTEITVSATTMNDTYYNARTSSSKITVHDAANSHDSQYSAIISGNMSNDYQYNIKTTERTGMATIKVNNSRNNGQTSIDKGSAKTNSDFRYYWKLEDSWKGNITATYSHCGYYKNTEIDVKLTLVDWEFLNNNQSRNNTEDTSDDASNVYVSFPSIGIFKNATKNNNRIGIETFYCSWIKVKYSFVKSGTDIPVSVKGYTTFNDIDGCQGVHFISGYNDILSDGSGSQLNCSIVNNTPYIFDGAADTGSVSDEDNQDYWTTATFSDSSMTVAFTFGLNSKVPSGNIGANSVRGGSGWIVNYNLKAVRSEFSPPEKTVSDSNETDVKKNTLANRNETFTYKISHFVASEVEYNWYTTYTMRDVISNDLEILTQPQVYDEDGENITDSWTVNVNKSTKTIVTASTSAKKQDFYDHTYTMVIKVKIKDTVIINDGYNLKNTADVTVNGKDWTNSNTVTTLVDNSPFYISKKFEGSFNEESYSLYQGVKKEQVTYTGEFFAGNENPYSSVKISDNLADGLTYNNIEIYTLNNYGQLETNITSYGTNSSSGSKVNYSFNTNHLTDIFNKKLKYFITVTVDNTQDGNTTEDKIIPNTISLTVDGKTVNSNTPKIYFSGVNAPEKSIDKSEISAKTDTVTYTISNVVDKKTEELYYYGGYKISDKLEDVLQYKSAKVLNESNTDVSDLFTITEDNNTVTAKAKSEILETSDFYNHTYNLEIKANIIQNADLSSYIQDGKAVISNTGKVTVNGNDYPSNTVNFSYKSKSNNVDKYISAFNDDSSESGLLNGNKVTYTGKAVIQDKTTVTSIILSDKLDSRLKYKSVSMSLNGDDINNWYEESYDSESNTIKFTFKSDKLSQLAGETIKYTLVCEYTGQYSESDTEIPNTMQLNVNDTPVESEESPKLHVSKVNNPVKSIDKSEISEKTETVTYTISNIVDSKTQEYFYSDYSFSDTLEDVLKYKSAKVLNESNTDVSDLFTITEDNNIVTAEARSEILETSDFYNHTYNLEIKASLIQNADLSSYLQGNKAVIPNTAKLTANGKDYATNSVNFSYEPKADSVDKYIINKEGGKSAKAELFGDTVTYKGNAVIQDKTVVTSVELSDKLDSDLKYKNISISLDGKDITNWGTHSYEQSSNTVKYIFNSDKVSALAGKTIEYTITCDFIGEISKKSISITNVINLKVNNNKKTSNEAILTTPVDPSITKYINEDDESYSLHKNSEDITYTGTIIPGTHLKSKLLIKDKLADGLTYKSLKIFSEDGEDITSYGIDSSNDSTVNFVFNDDKLSKIYNTILKYELVVAATKVYDGTATKNEETPNTISLTVEDETVNSNTPMLYRSGVNAPVKSVDKSEISEKTETVTYTISNVVGNKTKEYFYNSYKITDTLEDVLNYKSINVLNEEDQDVTDLFKILEEGNTITAIAKNVSVKSFYGHTYRLIIKASISGKNTDISKYCDNDGMATIPNTSTLIVDGNSYQSNIANFTYQTKSNSVDKYILNLNGKTSKKAQLYDNVVTYIGNAVIKDSESVESVVLSDKLDSNLKYEKMTVFLDDKDITDWGNISYGEDENTVNFSFNKNKLSSVAGEKIQYKLSCRYMGEYFDQSNDISNIITLTVNEKTKKSNNTTLKIPVDSYITKHIYNGEELVNEYTLSADRKNNKVYYEGSILVSEKEPINNIVFSDKLDSNLEFVSINFIDGNTKLECNSEYKNGVVQATLSDKAIKNLEGKVILWKMTCNYVGDEKPTKTLTIPNTANVNINKDSYSSNEVKAYVSMVTGYETTQKTTADKNNSSKGKLVQNTKITGTDNTNTENNSQPNTGSKNNKATMFFLFAGLLLVTIVGIVYRFRKIKKDGKKITNNNKS